MKEEQKTYWREQEIQKKKKKKKKNPKTEKSARTRKAQELSLDA
jgi:hypothetical protein